MGLAFAATRGGTRGPRQRWAVRRALAPVLSVLVVCVGCILSTHLAFAPPRTPGEARSAASGPARGSAESSASPRVPRPAVATSPPGVATDAPVGEKYERTRRLLESIKLTETGSAAGASGDFAGLQRLDSIWQRVKAPKGKPKPLDPAAMFLKDLGEAPSGSSTTTMFDVCVCGGTLGIFLAAALQRRGLKVAVVERGKVAGREQEWNISMDEIDELVAVGALNQEDVDGAVEPPGHLKVGRARSENELIAQHSGSVRAGFNPEQLDRGQSGLQEVWVPDVLHLGVRPRVAVERARKRFEEAGGVVYEGVAVQGVYVSSARAELDIGDGKEITARLVVDAMGSASPMVRQARHDEEPSGICAVVGTMASGFDGDNNYTDLIYTNQNLWEKDVSSGDPLGSPRKQYFWEAFPTGNGEDTRTTYLFTYMDTSPERPSLMDMMEDYWDELPEYQREHCSAFGDGLSVEEAVQGGRLQIKRCLFGFFPTYRNSPLPPLAQRVLPVGDASGIQSPLSFGGFGALTRHLKRLTNSIDEALQMDALTQEDLATVNQYLPNLSATWLFQGSMVVPVGSTRPKDFVNRLMRETFQVMDDLGDDVLRPFNQDVVRPGGLTQVLGTVVSRDPFNIPQLAYHLGPSQLVDWIGHYGNMWLYAGLHHNASGPLREVANQLEGLGEKRRAFRLRRLADAWEFGSGEDYQFSR